MEGTFFTIKEAAKILGCSRWTIRRLMTNGWLNGPPGGTKLDRTARVSKKSLFQLIIIDHINQLPAKTLKDLKSGRKNFARLLVQMREANCLSTDERGVKAPEPASQGCLPDHTPETQQRCRNHDFAAEHQFSFGWRARQLAPGDPALQDDLVQEMSLAVLEYGEAASFEYLFELAGNRAINYLEYEALRGTKSLSEARLVSDSAAEKLANLKNLIDDLMSRGVPREWIEEVLGGLPDAA
jgi:excisionase family DNA binding protein